ncbi:retrovirus-related pol polyprotein from transposon TNT 1-94 [Tanacetum coccineum]
MNSSTIVSRIHLTNLNGLRRLFQFQKIILTRIYNDIYSIIDACPNTCEMWKAIERLKQDESINVQDLETNLYWGFRKFTSRDGESLESHYSRFYKIMNELVRNKCDVTNHQVNVQFLLQLQPEWQRFETLVKQSQELKTVSYHKLYDILKQHQNEVNELRVERLARTANPLALVAQQQPVYHPQNHPNHYTQNSSTGSQQAATRNKGKAIVNSPPPTYDQEHTMVAEDDEMSKDKEIDKLMALISLSFKKSTNLPTTTLELHQTLNVGTQMVQQSGIQCYNCKEYRHVARECQKPKREKDASYHKEKMLLCKQEEIQEVTPDAADNSGPIFDAEPLHKVQNNDDNYNVFAIESEHSEQPKSVNDTYPVEQDEHNIIIDSLDMSYDREHDDQDDNDDLAKERDFLASLIEKLKYEIDDSKNKANNELSKTNQLMLKDLKKFQAELDRYHDVNYASKVAIDCAKAKRDLMSYKMESKKINADLEKFHLCLKEEMVADLRFFNSLEHEVDSQILTGNLKTHFLNEIYRLSREYYYADHINAILGVYTTLDEFTNLQCDYVDQVVKCERLEKELSKSKTMSKSFEALQKHTINLELALQQCKEMIKNDKAFKENQSNVFLKEHEQYFEIQDLKSQLQDKGIAISELKKLIEKMKGKYVETKFEKSSVIRQPNAFKSQRQSVLGKLTTFSYSLAKIYFSHSKSVTTNNVFNDFSKPVTAQILPQNVKSILKNTNVIAPGMCSKYMMRNLKLLSNFVKQFMGTVKFGNDQIAPILGYGDLVQGNVTIKRVYYVEGLNHNLFFVGQFCDVDLEVAFRKSTCYICDLKGNDLLTNSRATDLYSITLQYTSTPNPIFLMAKASSSQAWLWHRRLSHLNFDTINLLSKYDIVTGLPKLKFIKDHLCSSCELGKAKR